MASYQKQMRESSRHHDSKGVDDMRVEFFDETLGLDPEIVTILNNKIQDI